MIASSKCLEKAYKLYFDCNEVCEFVVSPEIWYRNKDKYNKIAKLYFQIVKNIDNDSERILLSNSCRSEYYKFMLANT